MKGVLHEAFAPDTDTKGEITPVVVVGVDQRREEGIGYGGGIVDMCHLKGPTNLFTKIDRSAYRNVEVKIQLL